MADEAHEAVASAPGMPQLEIATFPNQIFWLVVTLVVIYLLLSRISLPRIGAVLAERQGIITNDISAAEDLKRQASGAEAAYNQALADARVEANAIVAAAKVDIQAELADATAHADAEISAQVVESEARISEIRAGAMKSVEEVASATAAELVIVLAPGKADLSGVAAAVTARLKG
ncbi:MAG: F-type H+-transporting ATPase subunit b [Paracoccaceae bacterium]|jgi:F-type H+-transporting ATPase subunit b